MSKRQYSVVLVVLLLFSNLMVLLPQAVFAEETALVIDNFETATATNFITEGETVQISKYSPYQGTYCGRCYANGDGGIERAYYKYEFQETKTSLYIKAYFMISEGLPLSDNGDRFNLIGLFNAGKHVASVGVRRVSGEDVFYQMTDYNMQSNNALTPEEGRYFCVEFLWEKDSDQITTRIDGKLLLSMSYGRTLDAKEVRIGIAFAYGATSSILVRVDDLTIGSSDATTTNPTNPSTSAGAKVQVYRDSIVATCATSFGFMLDHDWRQWSSSTTWRDITKDANFKLIRIVDFKDKSPHPCIYWYESAKTGKWDWTEVDSLVNKIIAAGAQPLITLGHTYKSGPLYPKGMAINPSTGLPYSSSYAAYAKEWVRHFKAAGLPVRYYEIWNEPFTYFGWTPNRAKLQYFVSFWNTVARSMRAADSNIKISNDFITAKSVLNYWVQYGDKVDFLDFHKYDAQTTSGEGYYSDSEVLERLTQRRFEDDYSHYGVVHAQQVWRNARGVTLPVICSETNVNSAYEYGTDPRIQKPFGAVWCALMLKTSIEYGIQFTTYYSYSSSKTTSTRADTGGYGFGLINSDDNTRWYPYYVHQIFGNNIKVGDKIVKSTSSSNAISCLSWWNNGKLNTLLICKVNNARSVSVEGMTGSLRILRIDGSVPYSSPKIQSGTISSNSVITMNGYTVILLQEI